MTRKTYRWNGEEWAEVARSAPRPAERGPEVHTGKGTDFSDGVKCWQVSNLHGHPGGAGADHYDPEDGCPVFTSKDDVKRFLAHQREQGQSDSATYGEGWSKIEP